jgi:putative Mg2+ transporter-C (MgtC) family protein
MDRFTYPVWSFLDDFAPLGEAQGLIRITIRLILAAVLGGLLGYQRERTGKAAGVRTHMLVAMGAAFFALAPAEAGLSMADMSRVIQGIITGIGFIGAGTILKQSERGSILGLTTAAGIWLTAAVGIAVGIGQMAPALVGTLLALGVLALIPHISWLEGGHDEEHPVEGDRVRPGASTEPAGTGTPASPNRTDDADP